MITVDIPIAWGDMDAFGHVNNTVYFKWFETVRIATFAAITMTDPTHGGTTGPILATTTCNFRMPLKYPGTVTATCTIPKVGNTSFVMEYQVLCDGKVAADGSGVIVHLDYGTGQKVPIPDAMREAIAAL